MRRSLGSEPTVSGPANSAENDGTESFSQSHNTLRKFIVRLSPRGRLFVLTYAAALALLAGVGASSYSLRGLAIVATILTLPIGLVALIGLYVLTGVFNVVGNGFSNSYSDWSSDSNCSRAFCSQISFGSPTSDHGLLFGAAIAVLFATAAAVQVYVVVTLGWQWRQRRPQPNP